MIKQLIAFLMVGIFSSYIADVACYLFLDTLTCYVQIVCDIWDWFEYEVAHKLIAFTLYYVGFYGAFGSLIWMLEDKLAIAIISKPLSWIWNTFGVITATVIMTIICNELAADIYFTQVFETLYKLFN